MPVYNGAAFLRESIGSVLAQTFRDFELIAVEDGSTDTSWEVLETISDQHVRLFRHSQNFGVARARNEGVEHADCEYLGFLDADDLADPKRLAVQATCLDSRPDIGIAASRAVVFRGDARFEQPRQNLPPGNIAATLLFKNCIVQSSVLMRRSCWKPYRSDFEPAEDYDLWARLVPGCSFLLLNEILVAYRDNETGVSARSPAKMENAVRKIHRFQLERLGAVPKEEIHRRLSAWPADATATDLRASETWLLELLAANRIYEPDSLRRVVERIWFTICLDSWTLGPEAFRIYRRSGLATLTPVRLWQFFRRFGRRALQS
jgi:hypothetical protein